jgi:hypothetical protein
MRKFALAAGAVFVIIFFIAGCASKAPVLQEGKQVAIFVLLDRGIKEGMEDNERNDRNEVGQFMEEDLVKTLKHEGYNATLVRNSNEYVQGPANYFVSVKINMLRLVGSASRFWLGYYPGPTILNAHYEVSGSGNKLTLAYDDDDSTTRDWTNSPRDLNQRLVQKVNNGLVGKSK